MLMYNHDSDVVYFSGSGAWLTSSHAVLDCILNCLLSTAVKLANHHIFAVLFFYSVFFPESSSTNVFPGVLISLSRPNCSIFLF